MKFDFVEKLETLFDDFLYIVKQSMNELILLLAMGVTYVSL